MDMIKHEKMFFTGDPSILKEFDTPKSIYLQSCSGFGSCYYLFLDHEMFVNRIKHLHSVSGTRGLGTAHPIAFVRHMKVLALLLNILNKVHDLQREQRLHP